MNVNNSKECSLPTRKNLKNFLDIDGRIRLLGFGSALLLIAASLVAVTTPSQAATPAASVTICTDLTTHLQVVLRADKKSCSNNQAPTIFHPEVVDTAAHSGPGFAALRICTSPNTSYSYAQIRTSCAKYQKATDYYRTISAPKTPTISSTWASTHDGAVLSITQDGLATDSPIAYYLIKNLTTGITTQVSKAALGNLTQIHISGLTPQTQYSFTITAVSADGVSATSSVSGAITTPRAPVGVPAFTLSSASESRAANSQAAGFSVNSTGGAITSFAISPAAPAGMTFNTTTGAFTGTPTTVAGATVYTVTATNASGSATQTFRFTVSSGVAVPAFTLSSASESRAANRAAVGFTVNSTGGAITSFAISPAAPAGMTFNTTTGAFTGTPTTVAGATVYTVTATNASGSATQTFTFTVTTALLLVGDRGPGNGIVYYVSATTFASPGSTCNTNGVGGISTCKYLEVAPAGWNNSGTPATDPLLTWSDNITTVTGQDMTTPMTQSSLKKQGVGTSEEVANWAIGMGFDNTRLMKATSTARTAVLAYAGNDFSAGQWFIPSVNELNELCKFANGIATGVLTVACAPTISDILKTGLADDLGGYCGDVYYSSSEANHLFGAEWKYAWYHDMSTDYFELGSKVDGAFVRPIRAF